jgi:hypothetical protein
MSLTEYSPGDVLTASSLNANLAFAASSSNTNVVINGAMQVAQRGTSTSSITTSGYYTVDRFSTANTTLGTWTQSVEADAPTGSGFRKSLKMLCTTADASPAAGDVLRIDQNIEGQNLQQFLKGTSSAKPFSVSFWVKANVTGTYIVWLFDEDNTRSVSASYSISASATWEKKTITFPADTTGAFNNDNGRSLIMAFFLGAGSDLTSGTLGTTWASYTAANAAVGQTNLGAATSNYWQITGVQLEAGSVATPFEFEQISTTLAKCQRYYIRQGGDTAFQSLAWSIAFSTTIAVGTMTLPTRMRVPPTGVEFNQLRVTNQNAGYDITAVIVDTNANNSHQATMDATVASGLTAGNFYFISSNNSTSAFLAFTAEL